MKTIRLVARILLGLVFIFSGFVKAVDPLGTAYKFSDYFQAFGISFLDPLALFLSIVQNGAEFLLGLAMFMGVRVRLTSIGVLAFMLIFLPLTLYIAIANPVTDCGCFGDALVLTNWETFYKNIFFTGLAAFVYWQRKNYSNLFPPVTEWVIVGVIGLFILGVSFYGYRNLPIIDFRPFKAGTYLEHNIERPNGEFMVNFSDRSIEDVSGSSSMRAAYIEDEPVIYLPKKIDYDVTIMNLDNEVVKEMTIGKTKRFKIYKSGLDGNEFYVTIQSSIDKFENTFLYKNSKTGELKEMNNDEFMASKIWEDTVNWKYDTMVSKIVSKGYEPPIHDFDFIGPGGNSVTEELLHGSNYNFLLVSHDITKASEKGLRKAKEIASFASRYGYNFYASSASLDQDVDKMKEELNLNYEFYSADEIMLKTIVRSNPGLVLIKDGVVIDKWHYSDMPEPVGLKKSMLSYSISNYAGKIESLVLFILVVCGLLFYSVFVYIRSQAKLSIKEK